MRAEEIKIGGTYFAAFGGAIRRVHVIEEDGSRPGLYRVRPDYYMPVLVRGKRLHLESGAAMYECKHTETI